MRIDKDFREFLEFCLSNEGTMETLSFTPTGLLLRKSQVVSTIAT